MSHDYFCSFQREYLLADVRGCFAVKLTLSYRIMQGSMAGAVSQPEGGASLGTVSAPVSAEVSTLGHVDGAMKDTDMVDQESSSPAQQTDDVLASQQQPQQADGASPSEKQQGSKKGMHISETRYELGAELKQVRRETTVGESKHASIPCLVTTLLHAD